MSEISFDLKKYAELARQAAAEGCVLLENENNTLPLKKVVGLHYLEEVHLTIIKADLDQGDWCIRNM